MEKSDGLEGRSKIESQVDDASDSTRLTVLQHKRPELQEPIEGWLLPDADPREMFRDELAMLPEDIRPYVEWLIVQNVAPELFSEYWAYIHYLPIFFRESVISYAVTLWVPEDAGEFAEEIQSLPERVRPYVSWLVTGPVVEWLIPKYREYLRELPADFRNRVIDFVKGLPANTDLLKPWKLKTDPKMKPISEATQRILVGSDTESDWQVPETVTARAVIVDHQKEFALVYEIMAGLSGDKVDASHFEISEAYLNYILRLVKNCRYILTFDKGENHYLANTLKRIDRELEAYLEQGLKMLGERILVDSEVGHKLRIQIKSCVGWVLGEVKNLHRPEHVERIISDRYREILSAIEDAIPLEI